MNHLVELLKGGDLRSDGHADEVALDVIRDPELFVFLLDGLDELDDLVRGRTSHAWKRSPEPTLNCLMDFYPNF